MSFVKALLVSIMVFWWPHNL